MLISTRGRYALRILIDMAEHQSEGYVPLREIAQRKEISEKYLESIVKTLVQGGVLAGLRGKGGGYRLRKAPYQYTVKSILQLTEGSLAPVSCLEHGKPSCSRMYECRTLSMWRGLDHTISDYLEGYTLADLSHIDDPGNDYII